MTEADRPAAAPKNASSAGTKSRLDSPCRYSSGSTSATFGAAPAPAGQDHAVELRPLAGRRVDPPVVHPRADHLDLADPGGQRAGRGVAVADHQPVAVLVDQLGVRGDVGLDLGLQRRRQHPPGALAEQLVQVGGQLGPCLRRQRLHSASRRSFLAGVGPPASSLQVRVEGTPRSHARGSSTAFDHSSQGGQGGRRGVGLQSRLRPDPDKGLESAGALGQKGAAHAQAPR